MENPASCSPTAQQEKQKHRREVQRAYYWKNRDKLLAQQRAYYQKRDKAVHAARIRNYRQQNREKICAQRRECRAKNIEHFREMDKAYRSRHKETLAAAKKKYWEERKYEICRQKMDVYYYDAIQKQVNSIRKRFRSCSGSFLLNNMRSDKLTKSFAGAEFLQARRFMRNAMTPVCSPICTASIVSL